MWGLGDPREKLPFLELVSSLKAFRTREHRPHGGWKPLGLPMSGNPPSGPGGICLPHSNHPLGSGSRATQAACRALPSSLRAAGASQLAPCCGRGNLHFNCSHPCTHWDRWLSWLSPPGHCAVSRWALCPLVALSGHRAPRGLSSSGPSEASRLASESACPESAAAPAAGSSLGAVSVAWLRVRPGSALATGHQLRTCSKLYQAHLG